jgi:hypothetical protein
MIRSPQQDAAQSHEIARQRKADDLPAAAGHQFVAVGPPLLQNPRAMIRLPFVHDFRQRRDGAAAGLQFGKACQLVRRQLDKGVEFLRQRGLDVRHLRYFYVPRGPAAESKAFCRRVRNRKGISADSPELM